MDADGEMVAEHEPEHSPEVVVRQEAPPPPEAVQLSPVSLSSYFFERNNCKLRFKEEVSRIEQAVKEAAVENGHAL
jgi:hypothetical protein